MEEAYCHREEDGKGASGGREGGGGEREKRRKGLFPLVLLQHELLCILTKRLRIPGNNVPHIYFQI